MAIIPLLTQGLGSSDLGALLLRGTVGAFFVLARFRWVYDPSRPEHPWCNPARHRRLTERLCTCGYGWHPALAAIVAVIEIAAGLGVVLGAFTWLSALALAGITAFATFCTAKKKTLKQQPIDSIDCVSCYLWVVEPHLLVASIVLVLTGGGFWSVDTLIAFLAR